MPDITMCSNPVCEARDTCYRSESSGTTPSPYRQAFACFDGLDEHCEHYWPTIRDAEPRTPPRAESGD